jgi:DNA recombination protein RmuC
MAENAHEVSNLARSLYDRLRTFTKHFDDIGRGLDRALDSYNRGVRSLETRVLVTARRFKERGAITGDEIETLEPIDKATRPLSFDEGGLFPDLDDMPLLRPENGTEKKVKKKSKAAVAASE